MPSSFPAIQEPAPTIESMLATIRQLKQAVEILTGMRGNPEDLLVGLTTSRQSTTTQTPFSVLAANVSVSYKTITDATTALAERVGNVEVRADDISAQVSEVDQARIDGDEALANSIDSVNARYDDISASGAIKMEAVAAPDGYSARYSVSLAAGSIRTGLSMLAKSDGTSEVAVSAGKFRVVNETSGQMVDVFEVGGADGVKMKMADIGEVTAGKLRDTASRFVIDLALQTLKIYDETGTLRLHMGNLDN